MQPGVKGYKIKDTKETDNQNIMDVLEFFN